MKSVDLGTQQLLDLSSISQLSNHSQRPAAYHNTFEQLNLSGLLQPTYKIHVMGKAWQHIAGLFPMAARVYSYGSIMRDGYGSAGILGSSGRVHCSAFAAGRIPCVELRITSYEVVIRRPF